MTALRIGRMFCIPALLQCLPLVAQVEVDKPIHLTGSGPDARVQGIEAVIDPGDAASAQSIQQGQLLYAPAAGTANAIAISLSPVPGAYITGMTVHFRASADNTGAVTLNVNGLGTRPLRKYVTDELSPGDLRNGQMVVAIYDGSQFQMISQPGTPPPGSVSNLDYILTAAPPTTYTNPGYNTSHAPVAINATLVSGFAPVSLSVTGLPPGASYTISPGGGFPSFSSTLVISVGSGVAPGTYPLTVVGNGGITQQTASVTLEVLPVRRVFVSSGSIATNAAVSQKDALCASEAASASLSGTYRSWISSGGSNHITATSSISYRLVNNDLLGWNWVDLTDGTLANPIHLSASGSEVSATVYTGLSDAGISTAETCSDWSSYSGSVNATVGHSTYTSGWSQLTAAPCGTPELEVGETLTASHCFACPGSMYYTVGTCGSNCGIYNLGPSCNNPGFITWGPFTYYNCMRAGEPNTTRVYCFQE